MYVCGYVCMYVYMNVCVCMRWVVNERKRWVHVCMYICMYVHTNPQEGSIQKKLSFSYVCTCMRMYCDLQNNCKFDRPLRNDFGPLFLIPTTQLYKKRTLGWGFHASRRFLTGGQICNYFASRSIYCMLYVCKMSCLWLRTKLKCVPWLTSETFWPCELG